MSSPGPGHLNPCSLRDPRAGRVLPGPHRLKPTPLDGNSEAHRTCLCLLWDRASYSAGGSFFYSLCSHCQKDFFPLFFLGSFSLGGELYLISLGFSLFGVVFATSSSTGSFSPPDTILPASHHMFMCIFGWASLFPRGAYIFNVPSTFQAPAHVNYHQSRCFKISLFQGEHS